MKSWKPLTLSFLNDSLITDSGKNKKKHASFDQNFLVINYDELEAMVGLKQTDR